MLLSLPLFFCFVPPYVSCLDVGVGLLCLWRLCEAEADDLFSRPGLNSYPDDMNRRGTYEFENFHHCSAYEWRVAELWEPEDQAKPHLCVLSSHGHAADDHTLLRSEVLSLARLALYRLKERAADNHLITPVSHGGDSKPNHPVKEVILRESISRCNHRSSAP